MRKLACALWLLVLALCTSATAQESKPADVWGPWRFLIGDWITDNGGGTPGRASAGEFSFALELNGKILARRSFADYPAANGRPAYHHEDLTVLYPEGKLIKADFFDGEGHVIHYTAQASNDGRILTWLSDAASTGPRYRFTYQKTGADTLTLKFEIAPPGKPDAFATYVAASAHRKNPAP